MLTWNLQIINMLVHHVSNINICKSSKSYQLRTMNQHLHYPHASGILWQSSGEAANLHFRDQAETFICSILPSSPSLTVRYTPGGLLFKMDGSNLQYVTSSTFLLSTYATYLKAWDRTFSCGSLVVTSSLLTQQAKKQVLLQPSIINFQVYTRGLKIGSTTKNIYLLIYCYSYLIFYQLKYHNYICTILYYLLSINNTSIPSLIKLNRYNH